MACFIFTADSDKSVVFTYLNPKAFTMTTRFRLLLLLCLCLGASVTSFAGTIFGDTTRAFAVPTLTSTPKGTVALSWTEKDQNGQIFFYWAESADRGKTFGAKKLIFASSGIGNSRLMRPKLLFRPNGTAVAVFALRGEQPAAAAQAKTEEHNHNEHQGHGAPAPKPAASSNRGGGGRPSDLQIVFAQSTDGGNTWTKPAPVHQDKTPNIVRGFFDATVLANGEIGVAYLNDIVGQAHQRDLRLVTSTNGVFGAEKVLDPFVCDCCNISLLVDKAGALHVHYRENQENIRDIARMTSTDNGLTFGKPAIMSPDNWKVNGCPHSGPTSSTGGGQNLVAWFSGANDAPGIRVIDQTTGKRLFVIDEATAKNAYLVPAPASSVLLWEQSQVSETGATSMIAYRNILKGQQPTTKMVDGSVNGTNASGLVSNGKLLVAYEVRNPNNRNSMAVAQLDL